jgi:mRNA-degrading endonuclease toxin of MazEF toxin-antitoxin module
MVHQMKSLDWRARLATHAGKASDEIVARATEIIAEIVR